MNEMVFFSILHVCDSADKSKSNSRSAVSCCKISLALCALNEVVLCFVQEMTEGFHQARKWQTPKNENQVLSKSLPLPEEASSANIHEWSQTVSKQKQKKIPKEKKVLCWCSMFFLRFQISDLNVFLLSFCAHIVFFTRELWLLLLPEYCSKCRKISFFSNNRQCWWRIMKFCRF